MMHLYYTNCTPFGQEERMFAYVLMHRKECFHLRIESIYNEFVARFPSLVSEDTGAPYPWIEKAKNGVLMTAQSEGITTRQLREFLSFVLYSAENFIPLAKEAASAPTAASSPDAQAPDVLLSFGPYAMYRDEQPRQRVEETDHGYMVGFAAAPSPQEIPLAGARITGNWIQGGVGPEYSTLYSYELRKAPAQSETP